MQSKNYYAYRPVSHVLFAARRMQQSTRNHTTYSRHLYGTAILALSRLVRHTALYPSVLLTYNKNPSLSNSAHAKRFCVHHTSSFEKITFEVEH